jgi:hypothetical protein
LNSKFSYGSNLFQQSNNSKSFSIPLLYSAQIYLQAHSLFLLFPWQRSWPTWPLGPIEAQKAFPFLRLPYRADIAAAIGRAATTTMSASDHLLRMKTGVVRHSTPSPSINRCRPSSPPHLRGFMVHSPATGLPLVDCPSLDTSMP